MIEYKENKLTVLVDMDGVLVDLMSSWCKWINEKYDLDLTPNDIPAKFEDASKVIEAGLTKQQVKEPFNIKGFWYNLKPNPLVLKCFPKIIELYNVVILTAPRWESPYSAYEKKKWIEKYFGQIPFIGTSEKYLIQGDVFIDDFENNLIDWKKYNYPYGTTVCFWQPWSNPNFKEIDYKIKHFDQVDGLLETIQKNYDIEMRRSEQGVYS